jgi:hypothetical protein
MVIGGSGGVLKSHDFAIGDSANRQARLPRIYRIYLTFATIAKRPLSGPDDEWYECDFG